jgi:hypothetical protein
VSTNTGNATASYKVLPPGTNVKRMDSVCLSPTPVILLPITCKGSCAHRFAPTTVAQAAALFSILTSRLVCYLRLCTAGDNVKSTVKPATRTMQSSRSLNGTWSHRNLLTANCALARKSAVPPARGCNSC